MRVWGDELLDYLTKAHEEMTEKEDRFVMDETKARIVSESDILVYMNIKNVMAHIIGLLSVDEIRGASALELFRDEMRDDDFRDIFYRLVESGDFPEVWNFYDYDERV